MYRRSTFSQMPSNHPGGAPMPDPATPKPPPAPDIGATDETATRSPSLKGWAMNRKKPAKKL